MAIADDFTINYNAQTITYTGGFTSGIPDSIYTVNALYSYLQETFDEPGQMDDPVPMSAQTPTEYTLLAPWFIDDESMKALYEGAIQTNGWTRAGTNAGIVQVKYDTFTAQPVSGDIGKAITHNPDGDAGILVGYDNTRQVLWIRPDSTAAANDFDSTSGDLEVATGTCDIDQDYAAEDGESIWACVYSLGSLESDTELYVVQVDDFTEVTTPDYTKLSSWWNANTDFTAADGVAVGHIDILVKVQEISVAVDEGKIIVYARQYSKLYAHYELSVSGGRTPIPLAMGDDLNNEDGHRQLLTNADSGTWDQNDVGTVIQEQGETANKAIITSLTGTSPNFTIQYYLIGTQADFISTDVLEDEGQTKTITVSGAPTDVGPAADTSITATFGGVLGDVDEDGTDEYYSCTIDCNSQTLNDVYQRLKFLTRRGESSDIDDNAAAGMVRIGEFYRGVGEYYIPYDTGSQDNPFTEGETITATGNFSCILVSKHDRGASVGFLIVRRVRGTLVIDNVQLNGGTSGHNALVDTDTGADPVTPVAEVLAAPFGTFAGGQMFFARGVYPSNVASADASNYQAIDSEGNVVNPPIKVTVQITGLLVGDRGAIFEVDTAGGIDITKDQHGLAANNDEGDADIVVDAAIPVDTPGKSTGGVVRCIDVSLGEETRYRYSDWDNITFTLSTGITGAADAGGSATLLVDAAVDFEAGDVEVGDIIYNSTQTEYATVVEIIDADNITTTALPSATWANTNNYQSNRLDRSYNGAEDEGYVPIIDGVVASGASSLSNTLVYNSVDINAIARVRWSSGAGEILPFEQKGRTVEDTGLSVAAIRTEDTIVT